jgi:hypothetical protein
VQNTLSVANSSKILKLWYVTLMAVNPDIVRPSFRSKTVVKAMGVGALRVRRNENDENILGLVLVGASPSMKGTAGSKV